MGTVLIEISWAGSGWAAMRTSADRASAPGTVIGDLARYRGRLLEGNTLGAGRRVTRSCVGWPPHESCSTQTRPPGPDREPLARDNRTLAPSHAPEPAAWPAHRARRGRDAHSDDRDPLLVPARTAFAQRHGGPGAPQRQLGGGAPGGRVAGRAPVRSARGGGLLRAIGEPRPRAAGRPACSCRSSA